MAGGGTECPVKPEQYRKDGFNVFGGELARFADRDVRAIRIVHKVRTSGTWAGCAKGKILGVPPEPEYDRRIAVVSSHSLLLCSPAGPVKRVIALDKIEMLMTQQAGDRGLGDRLLLIKVPTEHDVVISLNEGEGAQEKWNVRPAGEFVATLRKLAAWRQKVAHILLREISHGAVPFRKAVRGMKVEMAPFSYHNTELRGQRYWGLILRTEWNEEEGHQVAVMHWTSEDDPVYPGPPQHTWSEEGQPVQFAEARVGDMLELSTPECSMRYRGTVAEKHADRLIIEWDPRQRHGKAKWFPQPLVTKQWFDRVPKRHPLSPDKDRRWAQPLRKTRVELGSIEPEFWWDGPPFFARPRQPGERERHMEDAERKDAEAKAREGARRKETEQRPAESAAKESTGSPAPKGIKKLLSSVAPKWQRRAGGQGAKPPAGAGAAEGGGGDAPSPGRRADAGDAQSDTAVPLYQYARLGHAQSFEEVKPCDECPKRDALLAKGHSERRELLRRQQELDATGGTEILRKLQAENGRLSTLLEQGMVARDQYKAKCKGLYQCTVELEQEVVRCELSCQRMAYVRSYEVKWHYMAHTVRETVTQPSYLASLRFQQEERRREAQALREENEKLAKEIADLEARYNASKAEEDGADAAAGGE